MRWLRRTLEAARVQAPRDLALACGLFVLGLLEATWVSGVELPLALALVVPLTIPLLWRTSHPFAVALVVTGAIVVQLPWTSLRIFDETFVGFVAVLLALYALGRHGRRPWMVPFSVACGLALAGGIGWHDRSLGSFVLALAFVAAAVVTGQVVAQRCELREILDRQAEALTRNADLAQATRVAEVRGRIAGEVQDLVRGRVHEMVARSAQARSVMHRDRVEAAQLVAAVEADGRAALDEMRSILGALRSTDLWSSTPSECCPGPSHGPGVVESCCRYRALHRYCSPAWWCCSSLSHSSGPKDPPSSRSRWSRRCSGSSPG